MPNVCYHLALFSAIFDSNLLNYSSRKFLLKNLKLKTDTFVAAVDVIMALMPTARLVAHRSERLIHAHCVSWKFLNNENDTSMPEEPKAHLVAYTDSK